MTDSKPAGVAWKHVIGIVGGLGPYAHVELERLILEVTRRRFGPALSDQDYPEWIVSSIPGTPDRTLALLGQAPSPVRWLRQSVERISGSAETPGADFAVIACNTAHAYLEELCRGVRLPILDMVTETINAAVRQTKPGARLGILATTGTLRSGIYASAAVRAGSALTVVSLLDVGTSDRNGEQLQEELVMEPIYGKLHNGRRTGGGIKSGLVQGQERQPARESLRRAVQLLAAAGAELVITGCTEIPLALGRDSVDGIPLLDPLMVAAEAAVAIALGDRPLPGMS